MGRLFNLDNPIMVFMGKVADLILLNLLAIVCSLPIITIGASWTALYYVTIKMVKKEEGYIFKDFFHSFKENFKQATCIWLMVLAASAVFVADFIIYRAMPDSIPIVLMVIVFAVVLIVLSTIIYVFPVLSRYSNTIKNTIKNAFLLSLANMPYTVLLLILFLLPFVAMLFIFWTLPFLFMFGLSIPAYLSSLIWVRIFKKLEPETEDTDTENVTV